jgi:predicted RNA-binding Zn-ribbon protein involved in translation (DUF1610 family)
MKVCEACGRLLLWDTTQATLFLYCPACGARRPAAPGDLRLDGSSAEANPVDFSRVVETAALDPVTEFVDRKCPKCGLPVMARLILGDAMMVLYTCSCGNVERPA